MDLFLEQAKAFAQETAKASQQLAKEAAKRSKEIVTETAKRSKELAVEATRKADQLKALAVELPIISAVAQGNSSAKSSEEELQTYGVTPELLEFVKGFTIETFREFPPEDLDDKGDTSTSENNLQPLLTEWEERHAVLILHAIPDISKFRYMLCPKSMKESRFWKIYFRLVGTYLALYPQGTKAVASPKSVEQNKELSFSLENILDLEKVSPPYGETPPNVKVEEPASLNKSTSVYSERDLDEYLLGDPGSEEEAADGNEQDGFDADFDELVNGSESETESGVDKGSVEILSSASKSLNPEEENQTTDARQSSKILVRSNEGSSDDEVLEVPLIHN